MLCTPLDFDYQEVQALFGHTVIREHGQLLLMISLATAMPDPSGRLPALGSIRFASYLHYTTAANATWDPCK